MSLSERIQRDIASVFLSQEDFAEVHRVEGKEVVCVVSTDDAVPLADGYALGVASGSLQVFCGADALARKEPGESLNVDGAEYIIDKWSNQMGMHVITISQTRGV
jgi:hypothetical protein